MTSRAANISAAPVVCAALFAAAPSEALAGSSYIASCSAFLNDHWRGEVGTHGIDPSRHVILLAIDLPIRAGPTQYSRAEDALKQAFPSFIESPGSGVLAGCCAIPLFGSVSFEDFATLSKTRFVPLCAIGRRFDSRRVGLRVEHREAYERHESVEAHFFSYWLRKPVR